MEMELAIGIQMILCWMNKVFDFIQKASTHRHTQTPTASRWVGWLGCEPRFARAALRAGVECSVIVVASL